MKTAVAAIALSGALTTSAAAQSSDGVVHWGIERRQLQPNLNKRAGSTIEEVIINAKARGGYFTTCTVGSNQQNLTLQLDTGSSDVWVPSVNAAICKTSGSQGCNLGTFNPSTSKSFKTVGKNQFDINYVDGSHSIGDYFTDAFEIGGANVSNLTMGLGIDTTIPYGLVGVGYALNEAIVANAGSASKAYANLPASMVNQGLINTNAYSLWLNDLDASTGSVLFGGVDTKKYVGSLTRINIYPDSRTGAFTSFMVALTSMQAYSSTGSDTLSSQQFPIPVVLDSGTTLSYLPTDLATQVWKEAGAMYYADLGLAVIPCDMENSKGFFSFGFAGPNGPQINVTMDELVLDLTDSAQAPKFSSGPYKGRTACSFGIQNFTSEPYLLGDTFLRSAYVVYDLVNNEIGIAATDFNATESNVVPFPSLSATIPDATVAPSQSLIASGGASVTTPSFSASSGFTDLNGAASGGASNGESKNAAASAAEIFNWAHVSVMGISFAFMAFGGGLFLL